MPRPEPAAIRAEDAAQPANVNVAGARGAELPFSVAAVALGRVNYQLRAARAGYLQKPAFSRNKGVQDTRHDPGRRSILHRSAPSANSGSKPSLDHEHHT